MFLHSLLERTEIIMPTISCEVKKCCYNTEGGCKLENVRVDGDSAVVSDETLCDSFTENKEEATNNCSCEECACDKADVECSAENCRYNSDGCCEADKIEIGHSTADCCSDTQCETFEEK